MGRTTLASHPKLREESLEVLHKDGLTPLSLGTHLAWRLAESLSIGGRRPLSLLHEVSKQSPDIQSPALLGWRRRSLLGRRPLSLVQVLEELHYYLWIHNLVPLVFLVQ